MFNKLSLLYKCMERNAKFNKYISVQFFTEPQTALENPGCITAVYTKQGTQDSNSALSLKCEQVSLPTAGPMTPRTSINRLTELN